MIKLTEIRDGTTIAMTLEGNNVAILDLEELFTNFVNAIGIRGFIVEINPEFLDGGSGGMDVGFAPDFEPPQEPLH